ncbi:MAG TPA: hypothetical protein VL128_01440 [Candidatus Eisenbacteria bacterium]|nr:hypothetical protein [Candidatus Eisenbacteria bacterium]
MAIQKKSLKQEGKKLNQKPQGTVKKAKIARPTKIESLRLLRPGDPI